MASAPQVLRSQIVGNLACQRDSYRKSIETKVISCTRQSPEKTFKLNGNHTKGAAQTPKIESSSSKVWLLEFTDSILFPEGGGQPTDHGTILSLSEAHSEPILIKSVQRQGLQCIHYSPQPLEPGTLVRQEVDFHRRWDHMQQHTGQHLLSAIMDTYDNLETLGWEMGAENGMNYVELPRKPTQEEIQEIQQKCNKAIRDNVTITVEIDNCETSSLPADYDKEQGVIRVIKIGDIDANPCCGTHLQQTSHISLILLHNTQNVRGTNCRLFFTAGDRAVNLATVSLGYLRTMARILATPSVPAEVLASVTKLSENVTDLRKKEKRLLPDIAKYEADRIKTHLQSGKNGWVHRADEGIDFLNMIVYEIKDMVKDQNTVILVTGEEKKGGHLVVVGQASQVEELVRKIKEILPGIKGGGKGRWQGKVNAWQKGELEALKKLVEQ